MRPTAIATDSGRTNTAPVEPRMPRIDLYSSATSTAPTMAPRMLRPAACCPSNIRFNVPSAKAPATAPIQTMTM